MSLLSLGLLFHKLLAKRKEPSPNSKPWPSTIVRAMCHLLKFPSWGEFSWEIAHMLKSLLLLASDVSTSVWSGFKFRSWKRERQLFGLSTYQTSQGCLSWESVNDYSFKKINNYSIRLRNVKKGLALILFFWGQCFPFNQVDKTWGALPKNISAVWYKIWQLRNYLPVAILKIFYIFWCNLVQSCCRVYKPMCSCSIHPFEVLISFLLDEYSERSWISW